MNLSHKVRFPVAAFLIGSTLLVTSCSNGITKGDVEEKIEAAEEARREEIQKTEEAAQTTLAYAEQEYGPYIKKVEAKLQEYAPQIAALEQRIQDAASQPEVKAKLEQAAQSAKAQRAIIEQKVAELKTAEGESATKVRDSIDTATQALEQELQKTQSPSSQSSSRLLPRTRKYIA